MKNEDTEPVKPEPKPKPKSCSFCQYSVPKFSIPGLIMVIRTFRNVGIKGHEDDHLCNLCDTKVI